MEIIKFILKLKGMRKLLEMLRKMKRCELCNKKKRIYARLKYGGNWIDVCKKCWKLNVRNAEGFQFK